MKTFDPISLRLFVAVCDEQSFTLAADREAIAPSAISKRLAALEEQIGSPLLERGRRGIELTEAGKVLLPAARDLLLAMHQLQGNLSEFARGVHGHVRVAASRSALAESLPDDVAAFMQRHKTVQVTLNERLSPDVVRAVEEGRADIGVCWTEVGMRRLQQVPYRDDHLAVAVHKDHALASRKTVKFADTLEYDHVSIQQGSIAQLTQIARAAALGSALRYRVEVSTFATACRFAAANFAVAIVPYEAALRLTKAFGFKVIRLTDEWARRRFVVCMRDRDALTEPARNLVVALAAEAHSGKPSASRA